MAQYDVRTVFKTTRVREIMTTEVYSVNVNDTLTRAAEIFVLHGVTHVPVVDDNRKVVGMISHKYIYKTQAPRKFFEGETNVPPNTIIDGDSFYLKEALDSYILKRVMSTRFFTLTPDDMVADAIGIMAEKRVGYICVVTPADEIAGIITNQDIVNFNARLLGHETNSKERKDTDGVD